MPTLRGGDFYDPAFLTAVEHFNRGEFFEAHESWEACWTSNFEKGLIQAAVCLYQLGRENPHGARNMYVGMRKYLAPYRPGFWGVDVDRLLDEMAACASWLEKPDPPPLSRAPAPTLRIEIRSSEAPAST